MTIRKERISTRILAAIARSQLRADLARFRGVVRTCTTQKALKNARSCRHGHCEGASMLRRATFAGLLFVIACSGGGSQDGTENPDWALFTNDKAAFNYFVGKGLTNFQAAG